MQFPKEITSTIEVNVLLNRIKEVANILEHFPVEQTMIFSHADHDGFTASALINNYFNLIYDQKASVVFPHHKKSYQSVFAEIIQRKPALLLILDVLVSQHKRQLKKIVRRGTKVINMDHHDLLKLSHENYVDLNPHNWQIEYLNSSGLVWLVVREINPKYFDDRAWVAGVGAVQDYCIDDNAILFRTLMENGWITKISFDSLFDSKLMKIAKMINATISQQRQEYVYNKILEASITNNWNVLLKDKELKKHYKHHLNLLKTVQKDFTRKRRIFEDVRLVSYEFADNVEDASLISDLCEKERDPYVHFGYKNGLLSFRSLFIDYDVRKLAELFGGSGPHPKVAGGKTKKGFNETVKRVYRFMSGKERQELLSKYLF